MEGLDPSNISVVGVLIAFLGFQRIENRKLAERVDALLKENAKKDVAHAKALGSIAGYMKELAERSAANSEGASVGREAASRRHEAVMTQMSGISRDLGRLEGFVSAGGKNNAG